MSRTYAHEFDLTCSRCGKVGRIELHAKLDPDDAEPPDEQQWNLYLMMLLDERGDPLCNTCAPEHELEGTFEPTNRKN